MQAALDELERRVGQRTRDLTAANRRLRQEVEREGHGNVLAVLGAGAALGGIIGALVAVPVTAGSCRPTRMRSRRSFGTRRSGR